MSQEVKNHNFYISGYLKTIENIESKYKERNIVIGDFDLNTLMLVSYSVVDRLKRTEKTSSLLNFISDNKKIIKEFETKLENGVEFIESYVEMVDRLNIVYRSYYNEQPKIGYSISDVLMLIIANLSELPSNGEISRLNDSLNSIWMIVSEWERPIVNDHFKKFTR